MDNKQVFLVSSPAQGTIQVEGPETRKVYKIPPTGIIVDWEDAPGLLDLTRCVWEGSERREVPLLHEGRAAASVCPAALLTTATVARERLKRVRRRKRIQEKRATKRQRPLVEAKAPDTAKEA